MIHDQPSATAMFWERPPRRHELVGRGRAIHRALPIAITSSAAIAALGYLLPAHRLDGHGEFHSNFSDGGALSLLVLALIALLALALRGRRFGSGIAAGSFAMVAAALALAPVLVTHPVRQVDNAAGQHVFMAGILATFAAGAALAIGEPLLYCWAARNNNSYLRTLATRSGCAPPQ